MNKEGNRRISRRGFVQGAILLAGMTTTVFAAEQCSLNETRSRRSAKTTPTPAEPTKKSQTW